MDKFSNDNLIKHYPIYQNAFYLINIAAVVFLRLMGFTQNTGRVVLYAVVLLVLLILRIVFYKKEYFHSVSLFTNMRLVEISLMFVLEPLVAETGIISAAILPLIFLEMIEYEIFGTDYDKSSLFVRKLILLIPFAVNLIISMKLIDEKMWVLYVLAHICAAVVFMFFIDWMSLENSKFVRENNKIKLEMSRIETVNQQLADYQERVKQTNEQINYQKIEQQKSIRELEQANKETESLTEVMRFMASTFEIEKCMDVVAEAIMDVKKAKISAIYIDKNVYMNKHESFVVKTNYTSMEHRLKKEVSKIFDNVVKTPNASVIKAGSELEQYRFIGDTNLKTFAIIPMKDGNNIYGIMIVGSDEEGFFDKGLNYYESCIAGLNVSIKSTNSFLTAQNTARTDGLTGIYNRLYFMELFAQASKKAAEEKEFLSVALFDIDKFKRVNDTYGHLAGDDVIKMVASVAQKYADTNNGFCCRYGGEEFLVVLPGYDKDRALNVFENMHAEIKATKVPYKDIQIDVNVCIGFSTYPTLCQDSSMLISRADKAMYYGKEHGRGRLVMDSKDLDE